MEQRIFEIVVFIFSIVIHEVSHGFVAERLGDPTARVMGRLTLNPLKHLDPFGSVILPGLMILLNTGFVFGWAKPVPFDPRNLRNPKTDAGKIALAGPISNLLIAFVFSIALRFVSGPIFLLFQAVIIINILLAVFNLVPIPPLDGSKILYAILPDKEVVHKVMFGLEQYGFILLLLFILGGGVGLIYPVISFIYRIFTGFVF